MNAPIWQQIVGLVVFIAAAYGVYWVAFKRKGKDGKTEMGD